MPLCILFNTPISYCMVPKYLSKWKLSAFYIRGLRVVLINMSIFSRYYCLFMVYSLCLLCVRQSCQTSQNITRRKKIHRGCHRPTAWQGNVRTPKPSPLSAHTNTPLPQHTHTHTHTPTVASHKSRQQIADNVWSYITILNLHTICLI